MYSIHHHGLLGGRFHGYRCALDESVWELGASLRDLQSITPLYPALKRRPKLDRPFGADSGRASLHCGQPEASSHPLLLMALSLAHQMHFGQRLPGTGLLYADQFHCFGGYVFGGDFELLD